MRQLFYFCKNSWWDERKARKVLLPLAFARLPGCSAVLVNAAASGWQCPRRPGIWCHPDADMSVLSPVRWFPLQRFRLIRAANQWFRWRMVRSFMRDADTTAVVLSDPEDVFIARFARQAGIRCWFDWTEEWDAYIRAAGKESRLKADVYEIFSNVDGIIAVSRLLEEKARAMGLETIHLQNAVGESFIHALDKSRQEGVPKALENIPTPIAVHIGSYNPAWIDWECLIRAAERNPSVSFCMIGGGAEDAVPASLPNNVYLLGRMAYEHLPAILAHSNLCMLLYHPKQTAGNDPTKLYEYLASGLPIVSTPHPRALEFEKWIRIARSPVDFAGAVGEELRHCDETLTHKRREIARQHTWRIRAEKLQARLF
ncbi:glycosyltransferase [Alcanivorax sp.]|uniref:glycosyltransferase family protein n=1 Tax=Alcanivorax sp. TaxID=1872427 RepID=UPI002585742F|nr:glycosyltransferase [Alcanivorax sp.]